MLEQVRAAIAEHGGTVARWSTPLDNHDPARNHASGYGVCYLKHGYEPWFRFWPGDQLREVHRAILIIDDGKVAAPYYWVGWNAKDQADGYVLFASFPTNPHGRTRPDNGQPVDSTWALGPRRAYHLKITPVPNGVVPA
jgi:hypothetical protein